MIKKPYLLYSLLLLAISNSLAHLIKPELARARTQFSTQQACVLPLESIRREHGDLLKQAHQAATVEHTAPAYQLGLCLDCHVVPNPPNKRPIVDSSTHFCQSCHVFVGIKIACFSCHLAQ